jgi:hypothetical protein
VWGIFLAIEVRGGCHGGLLRSGFWFSIADVGVVSQDPHVRSVGLIDHNHKTSTPNPTGPTFFYLQLQHSQ